MLMFIQLINSSLNGISPSVISSGLIDGGIEYYPLQGDMLRTYATSPEVRLFF